MLRAVSVATILVCASARGKGRGPGPPLFSTPVEAGVIMPATRFHLVNPYVFRVILKMKSGLNPATTGSRNANGTVDVGIC